MARSAGTVDEFYATTDGSSRAIVTASPVLECEDGCACCCAHQILVGGHE